MKKTYCCMDERDGNFCVLVKGHKGKHNYYCEGELWEASD